MAKPTGTKWDIVYVGGMAVMLGGFILTQLGRKK